MSTVTILKKQGTVQVGLATNIPGIGLTPTISRGIACIPTRTRSECKNTKKKRSASMPAFSSPNVFPRNPGGHIVLPRDNVLDAC